MTRSEQRVIAGLAVRACNVATPRNRQPDFAPWEMLTMVPLLVKSAISMRLISTAFIVRLLAVIEPLTICGLIVEGRSTDSLTYRLFANDPAAQLLAVLMGVFAVLCIAEMLVFVASPKRRVARHIRGMPYVFAGMMQGVLAAGVIASQHPSVTLATAYLSFGAGTALLGFRLAIGDQQFAGVGSV